MKNEIQTQLYELALKRSIPFCYNDYVGCPSGRCSKCGSDDLMRMLPGVGCEWGTEWIIKSIIESELTPVDLDIEFEDFIRQCYPETTKLGWMELDTVSVMKAQDPVAWSCAQADWESAESDEGNIISFDGSSTYYRTSDVESLIESNS